MKEFLLVHLTLFDKGTGEVLETTDEEVAKEKGVHEKNRVYLPYLVIPGESNLFPKVLEKIEGLQEGEEFEVILEPKDAFGERDPSKVKVYSIKRLEKENVDPASVRKGAYITIRDRVGVIESVSSGRVTVDFNHPYAGKTILVKGRLVKRIKEDLEKVRAIVADSFDVPMEDIRVEGPDDQGIVKVWLPPKAYVLRDAYSRKIKSLSLIMRHVPSVNKVVFLEEYDIPKRGEEQAEDKEQEGEPEVTEST